MYFDSLTLTHPQERALVSQEQHYYPFGLPLAGVAVNTVPAPEASRDQYNGGSELQDALLGAEQGIYSTFYRAYDPATGRFQGLDPLADTYAGESPYSFGFNDPVNFNDPNGDDPIFMYGTLMNPRDLVTGQEMWTGSALDYQAFQRDGGLDGNGHGVNAGERNGVAGYYMQENHRSETEVFVVTRFHALLLRPDADGYLTLDEANMWYRVGQGGLLTVELNKITLPAIYASDFPYPGDAKKVADNKLAVNLITQIGTLGLFDAKAVNDAKVYGNMSFRCYPNNEMKAFHDGYDFKAHPWGNPGNWGRNVATSIGSDTAGRGTPYAIEIRGGVHIPAQRPFYK